MIFRVSVPEKKINFEPQPKKTATLDTCCATLQKTLFMVWHFWPPVATYTTFKTQVYGLAPPPYYKLLV